MLPDEFCSCTKMENLNLADNQLVSLPLNFGHLSKLMNLRLDRNKLTEIPESVRYFLQCILFCTFEFLFT